MSSRRSLTTKTLLQAYILLHSINLGTAAARIIRDAKLLAWDEAPMMNSKSYELVNATLRDIMGQVDPALERIPFGGKVVVFGGDMRQTLPVVKKGSRAKIVDSCINKSLFWPDVTRSTDDTHPRCIYIYIYIYA